MRKIFLLFALCTAGLSTVMGQLSKGNLFIGTGLETAAYSFGTYTFNYSTPNNKNQDLKNYAISLSPDMGIFLSSHFILGGSFDADLTNNSSSFLSSNSVIVTSNVVTKNTTYSLGPFLRYYYFTQRQSSYSDLTTLLYLQFSTELGSGSGSTTQTNYNQSSAYSVATSVTKGMFVYKAQINLGISVFLSESIAIDIGAGYQFQYQSFTSISNTATTSSTGSLTNNPITYKASAPESGITLAAGVHLFIRP
jgi:hypothetical protein